jgi:hypothetical protein
MGTGLISHRHFPRTKPPRSTAPLKYKTRVFQVLLVLVPMYYIFYAFAMLVLFTRQLRRL